MKRPRAAVADSRANVQRHRHDIDPAVREQRDVYSESDQVQPGRQVPEQAVELIFSA